MCGRLNLQANPHEIAEAFAVMREPVWPVPSYDIRPSQGVVAVRQQADGTRTGDLLTWGLMTRWAEKLSDGLTLARADGVATKPSFKTSFIRRRCLVAASGFFEWEPIGGKDKQKWHVFPEDGRLLPLAGIWELWKDEYDNVIDTCAIITTEPNDVISKFHDRMPVILSPAMISHWLDPAQQDVAVLQAMLRPCPNDWLVATRVGNINTDSPDCIKPVKPQRRLFD